MADRQPVIALVGRPNVGKSTLFNRLAGRRLALVDDTPGVTRDRREASANLGGLRATVVDTAGYDEADAASLEGRMRAQTEAAVQEADIVVFVIDARAGVVPVDRAFAQLLRRSGKPVVLAANKVEGAAVEAAVHEAWSMGLGEPIPVSAEHGLGMGDLFAAVREALDTIPEDRDGEGELASGESGEGEEGGPLKIAVVGRPNAGKSTLVNTMLGDERMLTGPEAGITRDAISVDWTWQGRSIRLVDTAGMRRKARVHEKLEKLSVGDALRAIRFAEVVVLLLDAEHPFEKQDLQIADLVVREGRALVIALNKWDLVSEPDARLRELRLEADRLLAQVRGVPMVTLSGLTGRGVDRLMRAVVDVHGKWNRRVSTGGLNRWFSALLERHPPPAVGGRRVRLRYVTQAATRPPTFVTFCSRPEALPESYRRYLLNGLRETFDLTGVPVRLHVRKPDNPYAPT